MAGAMYIHAFSYLHNHIMPCMTTKSDSPYCNCNCNGIAKTGPKQLQLQLQLTQNNLQHAKEKIY